MKQPKPKPKVLSMYDFQNIYTGDPKTSPGVIKARADRAKADSAVAAYKKKSDAAKARAIAVAKDAAKARAIAVAKKARTESGVPKMKMKTPSKNYKK